MNSSNTWKPEIEKKYKIADDIEMQNVRSAASNSLMQRVHYVLQRDWVPDFEGSTMKKAGVLLRIRNEIDREGGKAEWVVTLKQKKKEASMHLNHELEASSENVGDLVSVEAELEKLFGVKIDLQKIIHLDQEYIESIKLTEHRMLLEKHREVFRSEYGQIILALDELPQPLGYFAEIEVEEAVMFPEWEKKLGLDNAPVVEKDYGDLVKELDGGNRRILTF